MSTAKNCVLILLLVTGINTLAPAQNLSFDPAKNVWPGYNSSHSISITNFKSNCIIAFVNAADSCVYIGAATDKTPKKVKKIKSRYTPFLISTGNNLYLLWITDGGSINYIYNSDIENIGSSIEYPITFKDKLLFNSGLTASVIGNNMVITSHDQTKDGLIYLLATISGDGSIISKELKKAPGKSADYPYVAAISDSVMCTAWHDSKDLGLYYADYNIPAGKWGARKRLYKIPSTATPVVYKVDDRSIVYLWTGGKNDNKLYYAFEIDGKTAQNKTELPAYFTTQVPVSVVKTSSNNFVLAYTGTNQKLYTSKFIDYDPAKWMEQTFYPNKQNYSLKDIVLPGAHDAGMSILTATGGQQAGTINECNTLTQSQSIRKQLNAGIRMFDLRIGLYNKAFYAKHCASDCMSDAIGGGYGEKLTDVLYALKDFLSVHKKETILLTFSHFCEKEAPETEVGKFITDTLGKQFMYAPNNKKLADVSLRDVAGKAIIVFEQYASSDKLIDSCSIATSSRCFINFKREYAATNKTEFLMTREKAFFKDIGINRTAPNDLVRLDWQLTQSSDEAAMVCNDFQDENINPLINGAILLTNVIRKHHSIRDMATTGNRLIAPTVQTWIADGTINSRNKPNIIYVDVADNWVTDYCVYLNSQQLYLK